MGVVVDFIVDSTNVAESSFQMSNLHYALLLRHTAAIMRSNAISRTLPLCEENEDAAKEE